MNNFYFEVLRPGINTTYQDEGRFGLQHLGITTSGCMDRKSYLIVNALLANDPKEGVIEFAYQGPLLKLINGKAKIAITGNVYFKIINHKNKEIKGECNKSYDLNAGDQINIIATQKSVYGYLGIQGGFKIEKFYNSVSTLTRAKIGPNNGNKINNNDKVFFIKNNINFDNCTIDVPYEKNNIIRVLKGSQFNYFSIDSQNDFFDSEYTIANSVDRMGMRLKGKIIRNIVSTNIKSEGITRGAIQVPADGQPIILLNDHPTIGGYPKIANVISADYDQLIQLSPGKKISFKCINIKEAEKAYKLYNKKINSLINNIRIIN